MKKILFLCLLSFLISSCAIFPSYKIGKTENIEPTTNPSLELKMAIYSVHAESLNPFIFDYVETINTKTTMEMGGLSSKWRFEKLTEGTKREFESYGLFKSVSLIPVNMVSDADLALEIIFPSNEADNKSGIDTLWSSFSASTLGIIPYWSKRSIQIIAKLSRKGKVIKTYHVTDEFRVVFSLFILPAAPFYWASTERENITKNIMKNIAKQMKEDKLI